MGKGASMKEKAGEKDNDRVRGEEELREELKALFPFPPYEIQLGFMTHLYMGLQGSLRALRDSGNVAVMESPTGTGKSLSLLTSLLHWLETDGCLSPLSFRQPSSSQQQQQQQQSAVPTSNTPAWVIAHREKTRLALEQEQHLADLRRHFLRVGRLSSSVPPPPPLLLSSSSSSSSPFKRFSRPFSSSSSSSSQPPSRRLKPSSSSISTSSSNTDPRDCFLLEEPSSSSVPSAPLSLPLLPSLSSNSSATTGGGEKGMPLSARLKMALKEATPEQRMALLKRQLYSDEQKEETNDAAGGEANQPILKESLDAIPLRKVWFTSRTHSQLNQILSELQRSPFAQRLSAVFVGSRGALCVNQEVRQASPSAAVLSERCLDLQDLRKQPGCGCGYWKSGEEQRQADFRDSLLAHVHDIEQLVESGVRQQVCPYYAARSAVPFANVVALSYQLMFHAASRESLQIDTRDDVVVVDEAHNLFSAVNELHSAILSFAHLCDCQLQLSAYQRRYFSRLGPENGVSIGQLLVLISSLLLPFQTASSSASSSQEPRLLTINDFCFEVKIESINLFALITFITHYNLVNKLRGFSSAVLSVAQAEAKSQVDPHSDLRSGDSNDLVDCERKDVEGLSDSMRAHVQPLSRVLSFLQALTNPDQDGRVLVAVGEKQEYRFLLLNPEKHISE
ncbi:MAG: hypothetical protein Q8P67_07385, partial [archaeon]|nr:hypothetical protein [archaeon]